MAGENEKLKCQYLSIGLLNTDRLVPIGTVCSHFCRTVSKFVGTETGWFTKSKVFTLWPFREPVCRPLIYLCYGVRSQGSGCCGGEGNVWEGTRGAGDALFIHPGAGGMAESVCESRGLYVVDERTSLHYYVKDQKKVKNALKVTDTQMKNSQEENPHNHS